MKPKDGDWTEVNSVPTKETSLTVPNLKEGKEYQFRVKAVNEAGPGTPSNATGPIVAEKQPGLLVDLLINMKMSMKELRMFHS